jgi:hypothetical protein
MPVGTTKSFIRLSKKYHSLLSSDMAVRAPHGDTFAEREKGKMGYIKTG